MPAGLSRTSLIPPARLRVKAGFVVSTPQDEKKKIILVNSGELVAIDKNAGNKVIFNILPGNLIGVASLLEREPMRYSIVAKVDSDLTIIDDSCMDSELKSLPVWLLGVIKSISARTHKIKDASKSAKVTNPVKSLATFCASIPSGETRPIQQLLKEFSWLTRVPQAVAAQALQSLIRRKIVIIFKDRQKIQVPDANLLQVYADYLDSVENETTWYPFKLTIEQKKVLVLLSTLDQGTEKDGSGWITFFKEHNQDISITEWFKLQQYGWFQKTDASLLALDSDKVNYYLLALRFESNIRGRV